MRRRRIIDDRLTLAILGVVAVLVMVSLMIQRNADWYSGDSFYDLHVIWYLVGTLAFVLVALADLRLIEALSYPFYALCILGLLLTALVGTEVNSAQRWLRFGWLNLQVSELMKIGLILALARFFSTRRDRQPGGEPGKEGPFHLHELWRPALLLLVPAVLIVVQPDLGTTVLLGVVALTMIVYEGVHIRTVMLVLVVSLVIVPVAWKHGGVREYQKDRIRLWLNPDWGKLDPEAAVVASGQSLQSEQAVWAIGSGEFWGRGSRQGAQSRLKYLPEMHTDMVIATFAEEQGFIGTTFLLLLFWLLMFWGIRTAHESRSRYCSLVTIGVTSMIGWQVFINIGMVAGLLPIVGLPLPFLSYGGSAALTTMSGVGLVYNIAIHRGRL
jgi:rod shape determining protein RodA